MKNKYFGARYYDSDLGRWLRVDPLAEKYYGWSPYNYSLCDPINNYDPDGNSVKGAKITTMNDVRNKWNQAVNDAYNAPFLLKAPTLVWGALKQRQRLWTQLIH